MCKGNRSPCAHEHLCRAIYVAQREHERTSVFSVLYYNGYLELMYVLNVVVTYMLVTESVAVETRTGKTFLCTT